MGVEGLLGWPGDSACVCESVEAVLWNVKVSQGRGVCLCLRFHGPVEYVPVSWSPGPGDQGRDVRMCSSLSGACPFL